MERPLKLSSLIVTAAAVACAPPAGSESGKAPAPSPSAVSAAAAARDTARVEPGAPKLAFPVACEIGKTCEVQNYIDDDPGPDAKDFRCGSNTYQAHSGVDIRLLDLAAQARGVDVLAAAQGRVARLRDGVVDVSVKTAGSAAVSGQECGNGVVVDHGGGWETQYCHLAKGSLKVKVGDAVAAGQPLAQVGLSGNTEYPHVHVTVRRNGAVVDPFAPSAPPGACDPASTGAGLWTPAAAGALAYKAGAPLNLGFAGAPVTMDDIERGAIAPPTRTSALVAYARAINLRPGDIQELTIKGPDGAVVASGAQPPLDRAKAQYMSFVGKKTPPEGGWPAGRYTATLSVKRNGAVVISRSLEQTL